MLHLFYPNSCDLRWKSTRIRLILVPKSRDTYISRHKHSYIVRQ